MIKLVIFDLDGTLLNTIGDLAESCNVVLARKGLPQHNYADYCSFVGNGIMRLVERAIPEPMRQDDLIEEIRRDFVEHYTANIATHTTPYDGIMELLAELYRKGVILAVASNKFQAGTEKLVAKFFPNIKFVSVLGQRVSIPLKPDPTIVEETLAVANVSKSETLYVGDSGIDIQTAQNAGVRSVGVSWGFRTIEELSECGADHIIDHPRAILSLLD